MAIVRGDEYLIPIVINQGDKVVTDDMVTGVRIGFGSAVCTYPEGNLTYKDGVWFFPLTQELSYKFKSEPTPFQVQVRTGSKIFTSTLESVDVGDCIFKGVWE